jgi:hypothetical protein
MAAISRGCGVGVGVGTSVGVWVAVGGRVCVGGGVAVEEGPGTGVEGEAATVLPQAFNISDAIPRINQ